jgi:hypothetical protein
MHPFPPVVAVLIAGVVASVVEAEHWSADILVVALAACLASALVAFNWWELWAGRDEE